MVAKELWGWFLERPALSFPSFVWSFPWAPSRTTSSHTSNIILSSIIYIYDHSGHGELYGDGIVICFCGVCLWCLAWLTYIVGAKQVFAEWTRNFKQQFLGETTVLWPLVKSLEGLMRLPKYSLDSCFCPKGRKKINYFEERDLYSKPSSISYFQEWQLDKGHRPCKTLL